MAKSIRDKFFSAVLHSVLVVSIEAALGGLAVAAGSLIGLFQKFSPITSILAALVAGVITGLLAFWGLMIARGARVSVPVGKFQYRFEKRNISIDYTDRARPIYKRKYQVTSTSDGLNRIVDSYAWTGDMVLDHTSTQGFAFREIGYNGLYTMFEVVFPNPLKRGQSAEFEAKWVLDNSSGKARPFLATTITHPTRTLGFELHLPRDGYEGSAYLKSSPHMQAETAHQTSTHHFNDGFLVVLVEHPQMYSYYELKWNWKQ